MTESASISYLSNLPVDKLSAGEIECFLRTRGVDVTALQRDFRKKAASAATPAAPLPSVPPSARVCIIGVGGTGASVFNHLRELLTVCERPAREVRLILIDSDFLGEGLRMQKKKGASTQQLARYLHLAIDGVGRCADRIGSGVDAAFDDVWPLFASIPRLASEVANDHVLSGHFLDACARLGSASESRTRCGFAWCLDLLLRGESDHGHFGARAASRLLERGVAADTAAVLYMLFDLRPAARQWRPRTPMDVVVPTAAAAWKSFVREARAVASDASILIRHRKKHRLTANNILGPRFMNLFEAMRDDVPLHAMFGMGASKLALTLIGVALRNLPPFARETMVAGICTNVFDSIGARQGHSAFLTIETLEGLRDALPDECAKVMPSFVSENLPIPAPQTPLVIRRQSAVPPCDAQFLDAAFWDANMPRLLAYASTAMRTAKWRGVRGELPAGANSAHDYVLEAVTLILRGDRRCPAGISPVRFLFVVIRTLISHDCRKRENRTLHEFVTVAPKNDGSAGSWEKRMVYKPFVPSADESLAARELMEDFKEMIPNEYRDYIEVLACDVYPSRRERADALGLTESKIRSMDKQIRRFRSRWKGAAPPQ